MSDGQRERPALRVQGDAATVVDEQVVVEQAIALRYNASPFAVMLATPADLDDFALGFSLSEGVIAEPAELRASVCEAAAGGTVIEMAIPQARFDALEGRRRAIGGYSGCGLCGAGTLQAAMRPTPRVREGAAVDIARIRSALEALPSHQPVNAATGGVHAAAYVLPSGMRVREDVGRHNALDKLIGSLAREPAGDGGFLLMSSRASYEIVHKAATAGFGLVVAISAPTTLAIQAAESAGMTLVAFARGRVMNVYCGAQRIVGLR